jgi:hypothetical protein
MIDSDTRRGESQRRRTTHGSRVADGIRQRSSVLLVGVLLVAVSLISCSHNARPDPRDAIKNMFEAMRMSDSVSLAMNIDLESASRDLRELLPGAVPDTLNADPAARLLSSMVNEGALKKRWFTDNQIVIGKSEIDADTALVEVSFIDLVTRVQYYNKMRLIFRNNRWVITDFRTL